MVVRKTNVQSSVSIMPSVFTTSLEMVAVLRDYHGMQYYVIPTAAFTPCATVEKKDGDIKVTLIPAANSRNVFQNKITVHRAKLLPAGYLFHFNLDGQVLSVGARCPTERNGTALGLEAIKQIIPSGVPLAPRVLCGTKAVFISTLMRQVLLDDRGKLPFEHVVRTGFYIGGEGQLQHTNKIAMPGMIAAILPLESKLRIKGIHKHAPDYAETILWFELKQYVPSIFTILEEEDLKASFMEALNKCL